MKILLLSFLLSLSYFVNAQQDSFIWKLQNKFNFASQLTSAGCASSSGAIIGLGAAKFIFNENKLIGDHPYFFSVCIGALSVISAKILQNFSQENMYWFLYNKSNKNKGDVCCKILELRHNKKLSGSALKAFINHGASLSIKETYTLCNDLKAINIFEECVSIFCNTYIKAVEDNLSKVSLTCFNQKIKDIIYTQNTLHNMQIDMNKYILKERIEKKQIFNVNNLFFKRLQRKALNMLFLEQCDQLNMSDDLLKLKQSVKNEVVSLENIDNLIALLSDDETKSKWNAIKIYVCDYEDKADVLIELSNRKLKDIYSAFLQDEQISYENITQEQQKKFIKKYYQQYKKENVVPQETEECFDRFISKVFEFQMLLSDLIKQEDKIHLVHYIVETYFIFSNYYNENQFDLSVKQYLLNNDLKRLIEYQDVIKNANNELLCNYVYNSWINACIDCVTLISRIEETPHVEVEDISVASWADNMVQKSIEDFLNYIMKPSEDKKTYGFVHTIKNFKNAEECFNYYNNLLKSPIENNSLKTAYRKLMLNFHPDRFNTDVLKSPKSASSEDFKMINTYYKQIC